jgi:hypothetical protein
VIPRPRAERLRGVDALLPRLVPGALASRKRGAHFHSDHDEAFAASSSARGEAAAGWS